MPVMVKLILKMEILMMHLLWIYNKYALFYQEGSVYRNLVYKFKENASFLLAPDI